MDRRTLLKAALGIAIAPKSIAATEPTTTIKVTRPPLTEEEIIALIRKRNQEVWQQTVELVERDLWQHTTTTQHTKG